MTQAALDDERLVAAFSFDDATTSSIGAYLSRSPRGIGEPFRTLEEKSRDGRVAPYW